MAVLAGYTLLLAATAWLLIRVAAVWDDARTVLLLVVLMFLATSVTFDEVLALDPLRGLICYVGGLGFAIGVSEGLLAWFRFGPFRVTLLGDRLDGQSDQSPVQPSCSAVLPNVAQRAECYLGLNHAVSGLDYLTLSLALFGLAVLISLGKGGHLPRRSTPRPVETPPS